MDGPHWRDPILPRTAGHRRIYMYPGSLGPENLSADVPLRVTSFHVPVLTSTESLPVLPPMVVTLLWSVATAND